MQQEQFTWVIKVSDLAIIIATLVGPILAVQAQKWLERNRAIKDRQNYVFRVLMATRAARLSSAHVEALNSVPVDFYGRSKKLKAIRDDWQIYLASLENKGAGGEAAAAIALARQGCFLDLLQKMSSYLGYDFNRAELENGLYYPEGHAAIESDQELIRRGVAAIIKGEIAIPMAVKEFPATMDDATIANQQALAKLLMEWLDGQRAVRIEQ
ncbi:hypothetical protein CA233_19010 [Sphingomonas sp. ABOLD]|uniref:DUF6680 domain-containing protein n=1 Tax=Sphingomonas trueperi TaxID=53317 RepID=A0A7X5Y440_9SPHN|nr:MULTISPECIES: DUF6680 family protein [Sphingomonas]NJB99410.1 hypothetical protein [Sphingomonas trueperi]RSV34836.1 hypothetical protein CA234_20645 [Sphingomonas sp. ABOLE]RSV40930.1 hypothetical protein CA233_19010 [Sphingomonas sp. ABOLD]